MGSAPYFIRSSTNFQVPFSIAAECRGEWPSLLLSIHVGFSLQQRFADVVVFGEDADVEQGLFVFGKSDRLPVLLVVDEF